MCFLLLDIIFAVPSFRKSLQSHVALLRDIPTQPARPERLAVQHLHPVAPKEDHADHARANLLSSPTPCRSTRAIYRAAMHCVSRLASCKEAPRYASIYIYIYIYIYVSR